MRRNQPVQAPRSVFPRRVFLKGAAAAAAATAWPGIAKAAANNTSKVNLACCGIGNRGADVIMGMQATGLANIVALCDTDMGAPHTLKVLQKFPDVPRFKDFREMLEKMGSQIDAVTAGVPDHAHFPITMLAMSMGKHVYVEKPMAHTFHEVELMMRAEKKYKVAAQMGNQGHSGENYFQFKAWVEAGIIKNVTKITAFMNSARRWHGWQVNALPAEEPIPATLDWDKWLTTAPFHAYNRKYVQGDWRCWYDFGNGALGDWGAHILDTAHEFLKLGLPTEVSAVKLDGHNPFIFPQASTLLFRFPEREGMPPVDVTWYDGVKNLPPLPQDFGNSEWSKDVPPPSSGNLAAKMAPGKVIFGEGLTFKGSAHGSPLKIVPESKMKDMASKLPSYSKKHSDHFANFLKSCQGEEECRSSFAVAGPLCQTMALGILAQKLNAKLVFDPATRRITNDKTANELLVGPPPRKGWEQFYLL